jgi:hypothetical protein
VSELRGAAHRGGVDGAVANNDSGGSGGASVMVVDQRKEGGLLAQPGKKRKQRRERKGVAALGRPFHTGASRWGTGRWKVPRGDKEWGIGLAVHPGGAIGQQRPGRGGSGQAALARAADAEQGRGGG